MKENEVREGDIVEIDYIEEFTKIHRSEGKAIMHHIKQKERINNMLILPIKKKWYDMIYSGEKKEEYRKLSPYYETRFKNLWQGSLIGFAAKRNIIFRNGYSRKSPSFIATVTLDIGEGKTEWGAEKGEHYYILKIHSIDELPGWIGKHCNDCENEKCKSLGKLPKGHDCALWQSERSNKE